MTFVSLSDGPHADLSMIRPAGPTQMVKRMQNPAGAVARNVTAMVSLVPRDIALVFNLMNNVDAQGCEKCFSPYRFIYLCIFCNHN